MQSDPLIIATRKSVLAINQANSVSFQLSQKLGLKSKIISVHSLADQYPNCSLSELNNRFNRANSYGVKGAFSAKISEHLLSKQADLAVHSLKDLPINLTNNSIFNNRFPSCDKSTIVAVLETKCREDLLLIKNTVFNEDLQTYNYIDHSYPLWSIKSNLNLATSSLRRLAIIRSLTPSITVREIRGNIDSRLKKVLENPELDGLILSKAAIDRLKNDHQYSENITDILKNFDQFTLDPKWFVPAPSQGVVAIEAACDHRLFDKLLKINHCQTYLHTIVERGLVRELGGDCMLPFGCYSYISNQIISSQSKKDKEINNYRLLLNIHAIIASIDGEIARSSLSVDLDQKILNSFNQEYSFGIDRSYQGFAKKCIDQSLEQFRSDQVRSIYHKLKLKLPLSLS